VKDQQPPKIQNAAGPPLWFAVVVVGGGLERQSERKRKFIQKAEVVDPHGPYAGKQKGN